jgi:hypothetical protein
MSAVSVLDQVDNFKYQESDAAMTKYFLINSKIFILHILGIYLTFIACAERKACRCQGLIFLKVR